jgi:hypothetical protein
MGNTCRRPSNAELPPIHPTKPSEPNPDGVSMGGVLSTKPKGTPSSPSSPKSSLNDAGQNALKITTASNFGADQHVAADPPLESSVAASPSPKISLDLSPTEDADKEPAGDPEPSSPPPQACSSSPTAVEDVGPSDHPPLFEEFKNPIELIQLPASSPAAAAAVDDDMPPPPPSPDPEPMLSPPVPPPDHKHEVDKETAFRSFENRERPVSVSLLARRIKGQGPATLADGERYSEDLSSMMSTPPKPTRRDSSGVLHNPTTGRRNKAIASSLARRANPSVQDPSAAQKSSTQIPHLFA